MIGCESLYGSQILVAIEKLVFRPAAYAILINDEKILLMNTRSTGKYFPPGGGVALDERIEVALKREVKEETSLEIEIVRFLHFKESFFYYDPLDEAYHSFSFFFLCTPKTLMLVDDDQVDDDESEKPRWVNWHNLHAEDFQSFGPELMSLVHQLGGSARGAIDTGATSITDR
jgi:8-oxo-dGTP pyrophosphatase MutT (NUDIX family)